MAGETIECTLCEHSIVMNKKECALAHSRAEARLLQQPSTLAPSAHPRGAFLSYGNKVSYTIKQQGHPRLCLKCPISISYFL